MFPIGIHSVLSSLNYKSMAYFLFNIKWRLTTTNNFIRSIEMFLVAKRGVHFNVKLFSVNKGFCITNHKMTKTWWFDLWFDSFFLATKKKKMKFVEEFLMTKLFYFWYWKFACVHFPPFAIESNLKGIKQGLYPNLGHLTWNDLKWS